MLQHVVLLRTVAVDTARISLTALRSYVSPATGRQVGSGQPTQSTSQQAADKGPPLINFSYEPNPQPFNCTTQHTTRIFAADPFHPFFPKIQRRVAAHDPKDFIWVVRCATDICKKPTYRHSVQKKLRRAFKEALRQKGYDEKGLPLQQANVAKVDGTRTSAAAATGRLSGALALFFVGNQKSVLTAKGGGMKAEAERILRKVLQIRYAAKKGQEQGRGNSPSLLRGSSPQYKRQTAQGWKLGLQKAKRATQAANDRPARPDWQR